MKNKNENEKNLDFTIYCHFTIINKKALQMFDLLAIAFLNKSTIYRVSQ